MSECLDWPTVWHLGCRFRHLGCRFDRHLGCRFDRHLGQHVQRVGERVLQRTCLTAGLTAGLPHENQRLLRQPGHSLLRLAKSFCSHPCWGRTCWGRTCWGRTCCSALLLLGGISSPSATGFRIVSLRLGHVWSLIVNKNTLSKELIRKASRKAKIEKSPGKTGVISTQALQCDQAPLVERLFKQQKNKKVLQQRAPMTHLE